MRALRSVTLQPMAWPSRILKPAIAFLAFVFTGRWPEGLWTFVLGFLRWVTRVNAYAFLLTDEYPPFSME